MFTSRSAFFPKLLLTLALTAAVGCEDSDDSDDKETPVEMPEDAATSKADATTPDASAPDATAAQKTIVEIAAGDARFTSLVAAVTKAGLVDALNAPGPLTVFAPTNDAFSAALMALGKTLDQLTADDLKPILTYHVVSGAVRSTDLKPGPVTMLSGKTTTITLSGSGGAKINDANITMADIEAKNGVVHVIDKVLLPPTN